MHHSKEQPTISKGGAGQGRAGQGRATSERSKASKSEYPTKTMSTGLKKEPLFPTHLFETM